MDIVDWTHLPPELLESISQTLTVYSDYIRFRSVCRSWRSSAAKTPTHLPPQLPWLLLPNHRRNPRVTTATFFDLAAGKLRRLHLPESSRATTRLRGSSNGWLVVLDESPAMVLLNPLTRSKHNLPPLSSFPNVLRFSFAHIGREYALRSAAGDRRFLSLRQIRDSFIKKIVLSSSPQSSDFVAVAVLNHSGELAYSKRGDGAWRFVDGASSFAEDAVFSGGLIYAVDKRGFVAVCDVSGAKPKVSIFETASELGADMQYLVNSENDLLLVSRYLEVDRDHDHEELYRTVGFEVFKMDWSEPKWVKVKDLGDRILFIGQNSSVSFSANDFSGFSGNCIYFTDDYSELNYECLFGECDSGIYRLSDGSIESLWSFGCRDHWPTPIWVSPNPC